MGFLFGFVLGFVWARSLQFNAALFYGDCAALEDVRPKWLKFMLFLSGPIFYLFVLCGGLRVGGPACDKCDKRPNLCECPENVGKNRQQRWE